ncbi:hypothetical protein SLS54_009055 [Diplodia seriata]
MGTALLCCNRQINAEVSDAIARLRAQRRLACSLRILLRNERHLFIDWTCVPAVATHYDAVHIDFKIVGKPQPAGGASSRGLPMKTLHPSALPGHPLSRARAASSAGTPWTSLLYERKDRDFSFHRHLFKLLARLRNYGPSFLGDPVIFSAITTPANTTTTATPVTSSPTPPQNPPKQQPPPTRRRTPTTPTTFTLLTINVLTPPTSHTDPTAFRPPLYPWLISGSGGAGAPRPQMWMAIVRRHHRSVSSADSSDGGLVPPAVVTACCREFFAWALHSRSTAGTMAVVPVPGAGGATGRGENAFLKEGFGGVRVLLDGREEQPGLEEVMGEMGPPGAAEGSSSSSSGGRRRWWEPVFKDEAEAFACDGGGKEGDGLHRYCRVTRELRRWS